MLTKKEKAKGKKEKFDMLCTNIDEIDSLEFATSP